MTVEERVLKVIATEAHRELKADETERSFEEIGLDSLDRVCILFGLEQEFNLSIPEAEARQFTSVRQIIDRLEQYRSAAAGA